MVECRSKTKQMTFKKSKTHNIIYPICKLYRWIGHSIFSKAFFTGRMTTDLIFHRSHFVTKLPVGRIPPSFHNLLICSKIIARQPTLLNLHWPDGCFQNCCHQIWHRVPAIIHGNQTEFWSLIIIGFFFLLNLLLANFFLFMGIKSQRVDLYQKKKIPNEWDFDFPKETEQKSLSVSLGDSGVEIASSLYIE